MSDTETRHIRYVFLDVVGFTRNRSVEAQSDIIANMNTIASKSKSNCGLADNDVILLPTGDGICVAIINPVMVYDIHVQVALNILESIYNHNKETEDEMRRFNIRVGLNENVDNLLTDINEQQNVAGAGINTASRIMGFADADQIMVSVNVHETLVHREKYMNAFKTFRASIKHGYTINVYQLILKEQKGLNIGVPILFEKKSPVEPLLSEFEAYYFANCIKQKSFLTSRSDFKFNDHVYAILLWFLSKDSQGIANQTEIDPYQLKIFGGGDKSIEECYEYYKNINYHILSGFARFIGESLAHLRKYFEITGVYSFIFLKKEGVEKLVNEHPKIWKEFGLNDIADIMVEKK